MHRLLVSAPQPPCSPRVAEILDNLPPLRLFAAVGVADGAFESWLRYGGALLAELDLSPRLREIAILEVARLSACEYELAQHRVIGEATGLTPAEVTAIEAGRGGELSGADGAVARFVEDVVTDVQAAEESLSGVRAHLSPREVIELLLVAGHYRAIAMLTETVGLEPDEPAGLGVVDAAAHLGDRG